jgi:hypothetical protein
MLDAGAGPGAAFCWAQRSAVQANEAQKSKPRRT